MVPTLVMAMSFAASAASPLVPTTQALTADCPVYSTPALHAATAARVSDSASRGGRPRPRPTPLPCAVRA
jgi:hypothetical protein